MSKPKNNVTFSAEDLVKMTDTLARYDGAIIKRNDAGRLIIEAYMKGSKEQDSQPLDKIGERLTKLEERTKHTMNTVNRLIDPINEVHEAIIGDTAEHLFTLGFLDNHRVLFTDNAVNEPIPEILFAYDIKDVTRHGHVGLEFRTHKCDRPKEWIGTIVSMHEFPQGDMYGMYHGNVVLTDTEMSINEYIEMYQRSNEICRAAENSAYIGILKFFEEEDFHGKIHSIMNDVLRKYMVDNLFNTSEMRLELGAIIKDFVISICKDLNLGSDQPEKLNCPNQEPRNIAPAELSNLELSLSDAIRLAGGDSVSSVDVDIHFNY